MTHEQMTKILCNKLKLDITTTFVFYTNGNGICKFKSSGKGYQIEYAGKFKILPRTLVELM